MALKILYVGQLSPNDSSSYRMWALQRLGHQVFDLNTYDYGQKNQLARKVEFRLAMGPEVNRLNRDLLKIAKVHRPDVMWADKGLWVKPSSLDRLRKMGIATVSYMIDNFFGPRNDPGWRLYRKGISHFDLHVTQRDTNVRDYKAAGARDVLKIQTAYEPTIHYPPPEGWNDANRDRDVSFIGTPYDDRGEVLLRLKDKEGFSVALSGNPRQWQRAIGTEGMTRIYREGELYGQQYREAIWRSKINLSFLTRSNQDEFVHKSFEIAGCGGFLLAERSQGHMDRFVEDEEAVFYEGFDELVAKINRWLPDKQGRQRIAAAGQLRAETSGYHNDGQVAKIVERLIPIVERMRAEATV